MQFSISKMKEVIKEQTDKRVSKNASEELDKDLQAHGTVITQKAIDFAKADDRKTVRQNDIRKAIEHMR